MLEILCSHDAVCNKIPVLVLFALECCFCADAQSRSSHGLSMISKQMNCKDLTQCAGPVADRWASEARGTAAAAAAAAAACGKGSMANPLLDGLFRAGQLARETMSSTFAASFMQPGPSGKSIMADLLAVPVRTCMCGYSCNASSVCRQVHGLRAGISTARWQSEKPAKHPSLLCLF